MRRRPEGEPSELVWLIAVVSMLLPWAGLALGILGAVELAYGNRLGYLWLIAGGGLVILDVLIDFVWARQLFAESGQPALNRRGSELIGRVLTVAEAIEGGRGKVFAGDTQWLAEGPDAPAGASVKVVAVAANVLQVEPVCAGAALV